MLILALWWDERDISITNINYTSKQVTYTEYTGSTVGVLQAVVSWSIQPLFCPPNGLLISRHTQRKDGNASHPSSSSSSNSLPPTTTTTPLATTTRSNVRVLSIHPPIHACTIHAHPNEKSKDDSRRKKQRWGSTYLLVSAHARKVGKTFFSFSSSLLLSLVAMIRFSALLWSLVFALFCSALEISLDGLTRQRHYTQPAG